MKKYIPKSKAELGKNGRPLKSELREEKDIRRFKKMKERKAAQMRGIRPPKKLKPNVSRHRNRNHNGQELNNKEKEKKLY